jgi:hypothetical protein
MASLTRFADHSFQGWERDKPRDPQAAHCESIIDDTTSSFVAALFAELSISRVCSILFTSGTSMLFDVYIEI